MYNDKHNNQPQSSTAPIRMVAGFFAELNKSGVMAYLDTHSGKTEK